MEGEPAPRKRRFIPKAAPRRVPKPRSPNERSLHARPKVETKLAPTQTAVGGDASTSMKVYGAPKGGNTDAAASGVKVEKEYSWPWDKNKATSMFFLQSPQYMPTIKRSTKADGPEATCKVLCFVWLPPGHMGKMLVYRSGAIKLKLGDSLFDVSSGMKCGLAQDVVVTNENEKGFGIISELSKRAIATPDIDSVLESIDGLL